MASSYGSRPPTFGRTSGMAGAKGYSALNGGGVASALAGHSPLTGNTSGMGGYQGFQALNPVKPPAPPHMPAQTPHPYPVNPAAAQQNQPQLPTPGSYDLNTDPVLQQITALTGRSDAEAQAGALAQQKQLLIGFGHQTGGQVGGEFPDQATAQAAEANPTSILASLAHQYDTNLHNLDEGYNNNNLFYSGARITGDQNEANNYQGALAGAAGQLNTGLGTIQGNLAAALGQNQQQRLQAEQEASQRAQDAAMQAGYDQQLTSLQQALVDALSVGGSDNLPPSDYGSSGQPGTIYQDPTGGFFTQQPSGSMAPAYIGPSGDYVSPLTYAGAGTQPSPITSNMVAAPVRPTAPHPDLNAIVNALFRGARGGGPVAY